MLQDFFFRAAVSATDHLAMSDRRLLYSDVFFFAESAMHMEVNVNEVCAVNYTDVNFGIKSPKVGALMDSFDGCIKPR